MGDAKRRKLAEALSAGLTDEGKIIEAGWLALRASVMAPDAPQVQVDEMRMAFFAGAQHLFGSIMTVLDPGSEPTDRDLRRMDRIAKELDDFAKQLSLRLLPTQGRA